MTLTAIAAAKCRALWGERWPKPAADALDIHPRTLQRLARADREGEDCEAAAGVLRALGELLCDVSALG